MLVDKFKAHLPDPALPFAQHTPLQRTALAFVNCDRFVNRWAVCIPSRKHCSSAREWYEIVANSMGLVSPACAPHVGELVHANGTRQQGVRLDAHGDALKTLSLAGNTRTIRHDMMRDAMVDTMRFYGVKDVRKEPSSLLVSNLSAPVLAQMQLDYARQNKRFMEGVRPDFSACVPPSGQHTVDPSLAIFDVKVHSVCKTHYPPRFQSQNQSVEAHAASVKSEYSQKLGALDTKYHAGQAGVGPLSRAYNAIGEVRPLVVGAFGEASKDITHLAKVCAIWGSQRHAAKYGLSDGNRMRSIIANAVTTDWAMTAARGHAGVIFGNLDHVFHPDRDGARIDTERSAHSAPRWNGYREGLRYEVAAAGDMSAVELGIGRAHCR